MKKHYFCLFLSLITSTFSWGQVAKTQVLSLSIKPVATGFELSWPENSARTGTYQFFYRELYGSDPTWLSVGNPIQGPASSLVFNTQKNVEFAAQYLNQNNQAEAIGYIAAGVLNEPILKGRTILVIDSLISVEAQSQLATLKNDLLASGWFFDELIVKRTDNPEAIKGKIQSLLAKGSFENNTVYIIGHVPVPYSGYFSSTGTRPPPDGHVEGSGNHTGAWPADVFYADFEGIWEDILVKCTTGSQSRHHNIGGDGKFDPSELPGKASVDLGRVDFYDMPAFTESEIELTKEYLERTHKWKMGEIPYVKRALIDNNFGSLNLASTGYHNFSCLIQKDSIFDNRDYFKSQALGNYLWSYGCGAGSYTSCNGIGNTNNFAQYKNKDSFNNIFTILAGSYFGDWDSKNNLLRASLAAGSLATFWGGIPKWYVHHMGLGKHIGYGARITQNNSNEYFNGNFNASYRGVHIALIGDPTLTMIPVKPVKNVKATSQNGKVTLTWSPSPDATQYEIYRIDTVNRTYIPVNTSGDCQTLIADTFFVDECNWSSGDYIYGVLAATGTTTPSGMYVNRSLLTTAVVNHINDVVKKAFNEMIFYPNPTNSYLYIRNSNIKSGIWKVIDVSGRLVKTLTSSNLSEGINLEGLENGLYLVSISDNAGYQTDESWIIVSQ
jgi:hypothetical protein